MESIIQISVRRLLHGDNIPAVSHLTCPPDNQSRLNDTQSIFLKEEKSETVYDLPLLQVANSNNIGIAVMQGLSGSFGVVLSVPLTVLPAGCIYRPRTGAGTSSPVDKRPISQ